MTNAKTFTKWCAALVACALLVGVTAVDAGAATIASQDFNGLSDAGGPSFDNLPTGSTLTNTNSANSGGGGIDFSTTWDDTRAQPDGLGPVTTTSDTSDFIGVNSFTGSNAPDVSPSGAAVSSGVEHNFQFNDGDGAVNLEFAAVDVSGNAAVTLSLNYWITDTSYESDDFFDITLDDGTTTVSILSLAEPGLEGGASADDGSANWKTLTVDVLSLGLTSLSTVSLTISSDTNSGSENIFVDNILFTDEAVPEPSTFALAALSLMGVFGAARRRQRS